MESDRVKDELTEKTKKSIIYLIDKASNVSGSINSGASLGQIGYDFGFFHIEMLNILLPLIRKDE